METLHLGSGKRLVFATQDRACQLLSTPDEFSSRMSPFERLVRMKTAEEVSQAEFLAFAAQSGRAWLPGEIESIRGAVDIFRPAIKPYTDLLPHQVELVKTSGEEEGGAAYTRGSAIFLPQVRFERPESELPGLIVHELFHVITRLHPDVRDRLYSIIGYRRCTEIRLPGALAEREITNPDSAHNCHFIELDWLGKVHAFVPAIYSSTRHYDPSLGGNQFHYLVFRMLGVEEREREWYPTQYKNHKPQLVKLNQLGGFYEQVGRNTNYVVQPEEILASNFTLLILGQKDVPSPKILLEMEKYLKD
jgi:hypothetical protein